MTDEELRQGLEKAFDYRGDVTITLRDGRSVEGYLFDRHNGSTLADSYVRIFPKDQNQKVSISFAEVAGVALTGRDTAAGKSWEAWVRNYMRKKAAGEKHIALTPEPME